MSKRSHSPICSEEDSSFCNLLTGCANLLIYQALLSVFDSIFESTGHVVVVASPLVNLIKDQVDKLANLGILSTCSL